MIPTGTILPFIGVDHQLPNGFYFCHGQIISKKEDKKLFEHLVNANPEIYQIDNDQAKLPDLRGEFLRGCDDRENKERVVGTWQQEGFKRHTHKLGVTSYGPAGHDATYVNWNYMSDVPDKGFRKSLSEDGIDETRPRNIAVEFIIKR